MKIARLVCLTAALALGSNLSVQAQSSTVEQLEPLLEKGDLKSIQKLIGKLPDDEQAKVLSALNLDLRIVGGRPAKIESFHWQVALLDTADQEPVRSQFCGGTLIAPDLVLTAAHCVDNAYVVKKAERVDVLAGTAYYPNGGERVQVAEIFIHPLWNVAQPYDYDFAVLKLKSSVTTGRAIPLQAAPATAGEKAWVSGWGALCEGGYGTPRLMEVDLPIVDRETCRGVDGYGKRITNSMICAGVRPGGLDSCQGDSGGPLVTGYPASPRLVGVVSWGIGCARKDVYGVYADVSTVLAWIKQVGGGAVRTV